VLKSKTLFNDSNDSPIPLKSPGYKDKSTHHLTTPLAKGTFREVEILVFTGYTLQG
jgi:hypothetical protein